MTEFNMSQANREKLFKEAHSILEKRKTRVQKRVLLKNKIKDQLKAVVELINVDKIAAQLLVPTAAAIAILLMAVPAVEYEHEQLEFDTKVYIAEFDQEGE